MSNLKGDVMLSKQKQRVQIGVLGAGPIAQFAHFESCLKANNADLYAICDVADDLLQRMAAIYEPSRKYNDYSEMLADPGLDAVIIATSDRFHVPAAIAALNAGKHVLCEKPIGVNVEEVMELKRVCQRSGKLLQVGHMKRFDPGIQSAKQFIDNEIGELQAIKAWYCDSTHRYTNTDAIQPLPVLSSQAKKPAGDPKANREQYYMLAHGSHLIDLARYLGGEIEQVRARLSNKFGSDCWFVDVDYANGCLGHLDLTISVRMDWHEGFTIYGEHGSVLAKTYNPWYYRSSEVDIFSEKTGSYSRVLGADGHFYRRQVEGFARAIIEGTPVEGANIDDALASVQTMVAIRQSVVSGKPVAVKDATGEV
jgi:predicted dehydrogenase